MSPHQYVYRCVGKCCLTNQTSRRHSRKRRALRYLLSLILPDRIARRIFPGTPPTINGHSRSRAALHLDKPNVLHDVHRISTPILIDCPPESPTTLYPDKSNVLHDVHRVSTPPTPIDGSPESPAILRLDKSNVLHDLHRVSTPIPIDDPPESPAPLHLDKSNVLHDLNRVNTPILIDGPSELPETLHADKLVVLHNVHRVNTPPTPIDDPPESPATLHVDKSNVLHDVHRVNTPPILIDGPPDLLETLHVDKPNALHDVHRVNTPPILIDGRSESGATQFFRTSDVLRYDKRTSYVLYLQLLLTVWAGRVTINILPDDVLLHILHFDRATFSDEVEDAGQVRSGMDSVTDLSQLQDFVGREDVDPVRRRSWNWHRLIHVCRRWRSVVFASPNFLDLKLVYGPTTRVELTDIWPPLPIIIRDMVNWIMPGSYDFDVVFAHHCRVCEINLHRLTRWQLQRVASAMQEQFPALVHLMLEFAGSYSRPALALPDGFLGGFAPRLQSLELRSIPFPALPRLLLSATDLIRLDLVDIPHSGYMSPEAIVTGLAMLSNLISLTLKFKSPLSRPDRERRYPPPLTRTALHALTRFEFKGVSEYLEYIVARIDTPLLDSIRITFFQQLIFDIPQLAQFMRRTTRFQTLNEADMIFNDTSVQVGYLPPTWTLDENFGLRISCRDLEWQLSSLAQVITSFFPSIYIVEHLYIHWPQHLPSRWQDDIENIWLEILYPFSAVKSLYISKTFVKCIAVALQELVGERVTDVLPALESLFLEELPPSGPVREAIGQFIAARQLLGRPVAISNWNRTREALTRF
jgi:F-box-like